MRYTVEQINKMLSQGQSKTDWERVRDMSEEEEAKFNKSGSNILGIC